MEKLMPPLVAQLLRAVKEFRDNDYAGASEISRGNLVHRLREMPTTHGFNTSSII
jgi:hypothetical protein